ncbi:MAG: hypothetical protein QOG89_3580 [Thermomicrobiales bacterium]|nr:hypothetical protein [Thermomicrobiales bacterium]
MRARRWQASRSVNVGSEMTAITRLALFGRVPVASHCRTTAPRIRIGLGSGIVVTPPDAHVRSRGTERSHSKQARRKAVPWRPSSRRQRDARGRSVPKGDGGKRSQELVPPAGIAAATDRSEGGRADCLSTKIPILRVVGRFIGPREPSPETRRAADTISKEQPPCRASILDARYSACIAVGRVSSPPLRRRGDDAHPTALHRQRAHVELRTGPASCDPIPWHNAHGPS